MKVSLTRWFRQAEEKLGPEGVISLGGLITSWLVVLVHGWLVRSLDLDLSGVTYVFVLPIGAICMGAAAASGHYLASIHTDRPARTRIAINMAVLSLCTYAWMRFEVYNSIRLPGGDLLSSRMGFWDYYTTTIENTEFRMHSGSSRSSRRDEPIPLGSWGYGFELLRVAGFGLAGFLLYTKMRSRPWCEACKRYFVGREVLLRTDDAKALDRFAARLVCDTTDLGARFEQTVRERVRQFEVRMTRCPACDTKRLDCLAFTRRGPTRFASYLFRGESPYRLGSELSGTREPELPPPPGRVVCWSCGSAMDATPETADQRIPCPGCGILTRQADAPAARAP